MQIRSQMESLVEKMLDGRIMLNEAINEFEKLYIQKALSRNSGHISQTSEMLGIHRNTLAKRLVDYEPKKAPLKRKSAKSSR